MHVCFPYTGVYLQIFKYTYMSKSCACEMRSRYAYLFVLRFYDPVNPMGSCRARLVYLTTRSLGRLSPLSG